MTAGIDIAATAAMGDSVSLRRWFGVFALYLLLLTGPIAWMLTDLGRPWMELFDQPGQFTLAYQQMLKLLIFTLYLSLCCTFCPLPTGWLVTAIATQEVALTGELYSTAALVALTGAIGSTMANLNDYHLFTLLLRNHRVAAVRNTRLLRYASRWFDRAPFAFLVVFNVVPIPVDVIRMLAATSRYPRGAFAGANFIGRFIRYGMLAWLAFRLGISPKAATIIMLGVAAAMGATRLAPPLIRRVLGRRGISQ